MLSTIFFPLSSFFLSPPLLHLTNSEHIHCKIWPRKRLRGYGSVWFEALWKVQ
jgi:hypothetical protein